MKTVTVIGAGPAGLAGCYALAKEGHRVTVIEQDRQVGGLSKTVHHEGFRCDIGGHRFFTKSAEVNRLWREVLGDEFLVRPRLSRIYYRQKFFNYPLKPLNALSNLGPWTSLEAMLSFLRAKFRPKRPEASFEDWVSNRFGEKLYQVFFKTYSEKVWGIPCTELSADWAAQRIRNLSLGKAVVNALGFGKGKNVASLIEEFYYPRLGPGQMYDQMAEKAQHLGADLRLGHRTTAINHEDGCVESIVVETPEGRKSLTVESLMSSMPLSELALTLRPSPPPAVLDAARGLKYRSILTVNLFVQQPEIVPDTWIYIHDPEVRAGRLQLYKNWSPAMVPDPSWSSVGLEYFAFEGDGFWSADDERLLQVGREDLAKLNLTDPSKVHRGFVVRYPKAYPIYDEGYQDCVATIRSYLNTLRNLVCVGRYGQFRYNNMDHSIMTALLGVRRLLGENVDPWSVNEEAEYHEETKEATAQ